MHKSIKPQQKKLKKYIHSFNKFSLSKTNLKGNEDMIIPDALTDIWITKGSGLLFSYNNKDFIKLPNNIVWGLFNKKCYLKSTGITQILSVKIHPIAFTTFINYSLTNLINSYINLTGVLNKKDSDFFNYNYSINNLESYFINKVKDSNYNNILFNTYHLILKNNGQIKISQIEKQLKVSRQYINSNFKKHTGLSVKQYVTILKIRFCIDFFINEKPKSLTELAYRFNFFDQAHFINQFKNIIGETPKTFFNKKILLKQYL